jgi:hypothetical protein
MKSEKLKVGDLCSIWDGEIGPPGKRENWVLGVVVKERRTSRDSQYQVHWSNTGYDKTWYSERDIGLRYSPHAEGT